MCINLTTLTKEVGINCPSIAGARAIMPSFPPKFPRIICGVNLIFLLSLSVSFKEGYVRYHTVLKALGTVPDPVSGKSTKLKVKVGLKEGDRLYFKLKVPVRSFKSGNTTRDREVAKILGYPKYKYIHFSLIAYPKDAIDRVLNSDSGVVKVKAKLKVKGKAKTYTWKVKYRWLSDNLLELKTSRHVKFTDFGIDPPTLFGFVKRAPDDVEVSGRIILEVRR